MEMFNEETGKQSSKRIAGIAYLGMGLVFILIDQVFEKEIEFQTLVLVIGTGAGLLGMHIFQHFKKNKVEPPTK